MDYEIRVNDVTFYSTNNKDDFLKKISERAEEVAEDPPEIKWDFYFKNKKLCTL